ncbi:MAG: triose-phosphate isomerase, partial [Bacteroidota bacterium]
MRKKIVAGNWKMNKDLSEGQALAQEILNRYASEVPESTTIVLNPAFIHLTELSKQMPEGKNIFLGAQNCSYEASGAYTGEVSVAMLKSVPVRYTIIGHSERRQYFQETNAQLAKKLDLLLEASITPIFCCGEALEIREAGTHIDFVKKQLEESLFHLSAEAMQQVVIAYEPIWAIGTGKTASSEQAQEMQAAIRAQLAAKFGDDIV